VQDGVVVFARPAPDAEGVSPARVPRRPGTTPPTAPGCPTGAAPPRPAPIARAASAFRADRALGAEIARRYGEYAGDAHPTGGVAALSYLPDVPFEDTASTTSSTAGPGPSSRVMCLSCHRAHATSAPVRWPRRSCQTRRAWVLPEPWRTAGPLCSKWRSPAPGKATCRRICCFTAERWAARHPHLHAPW
jgi:hypothetical protein